MVELSAELWPVPGMDLAITLDVTTQLVTFAVVGLGLGVAMSIYWWRQRSVPGLGLLTIGVILGASGVALVAGRAYFALWISVMAGNAVVGSSHIALLGGLRRFYGRPARMGLVAGSLVLVTALLTYDVFTRDDIVLRSVITTIWLVSMKLLVAYECWRYGRSVTPRLWVVIVVIFGAMAVVMTYRIIDILMHPKADGLFAANPAASLNFLLATLGLVVGSIAIMTISNERLQHRLEQEAAENARVAQERDRAAHTADAANRAKSVFLAAVSHEIRTPVNAVLGGLEILESQPMAGGAAQRKVLEVMEKAGQSMLALLDDLLDITRIEAGHLSLVPQPVDLHQRLHDAIDLMAGRASAGGLSLDLVIAPDVPRHVSVDPARLRQILLNLIGNGIKFTERGGLRVEVTRRPPPAIRPGAAAPGVATLRITIADTGIGIAPEKLPHIFEAFYQAEAGNSRRFGGVGLGLAICKRLIAMMGGTIQVDSAPGHGSVFTLDLPVPLAAAPVQAAGARLLPYWTSSPHILLVEDDSVNQFVAGQLLTRQGIMVTMAEDGETALRLLETLSVRLVLMDIGMPGLDGFETTARLRASGGPMADVPVVALTANVLPETVARSRAVGMQGFLSKPIKLEEMLAALSRHIPPDGVGAVAVGGTTEMAAPPAARPADTGPLAGLRNRLGGPAIDTLLTLAAQNVADARLHLRPVDADGPQPDLGAIRRLALRLADGLDAVGFPADAQALRDCLGLLRSGQPMNTALAAMDAILADAQARLPRPRAAAAE